MRRGLGPAAARSGGFTREGAEPRVAGGRAPTFGNEEVDHPGMGANQPLPAFGLRPWLALERRALRLRRFALAMVGRGYQDRRAWREPVVLRSREWVSPPLGVARRMAERAAGIRGVPPGHGVLMRTRSVHGFGLVAPLGVVAIESDGRVSDVRVLRPGRVMWLGRVRWVAELPAECPPPRRGSRLRPARLRPMLAGCPER
jgi:hypothetical protein